MPSAEEEKRGRTTFAYALFFASGHILSAMRMTERKITVHENNPDATAPSPESTDKAVPSIPAKRKTIKNTA